MSKIEKRKSLDTTLPTLVAKKRGDTSRACSGDLGERSAETIEDIYVEAETRRLHKIKSTFSSGSVPSQSSQALRDLLNISNLLADGASAIVDDSFLRCFARHPDEPWNFTPYLWPVWVIGVFVRHFILFPLRLVSLVLFILLTLMVFFPLSFLMKPSPLKSKLERKLVQVLPKLFLMSWSAVVRYHGPMPVPAPGRVWVSNHTSMIDYALICSLTPFAAIMQLHSGWIAFLQTRLLTSLGCLWFNRTEAKDRSLVVRRMKEHVFNPDAVPLLIFPEGTCVNNEYTVLFKRGAFDIPNTTVCPVAIKYNKIFVDAFHNSKKESFSTYLLKLMSSWAVVADVWFLEPQQRLEGESADEFAARVQKMIADKAKLRVVPWDGYLKYYNLGTKNPGLIEKRRKVSASCHMDGYLKYYNLGTKNPGLIEKRRKVFADVLKTHLPGAHQTIPEEEEPKKVI
eukprot:gene15756-21879_t